MTVRDTAAMIGGMDPALWLGAWVYCSSEHPAPEALADALATFREPEGFSLLLPAERAAELGFPPGPAMRVIQLRVHSSLEGVGLTAAVSSRLAEHRIASNMIAASHHDYLLVPEADAERALDLLRALQAEAAT